MKRVKLIEKTKQIIPQWKRWQKPMAEAGRGD
jgi:hypothetical protein